MNEGLRSAVDEASRAWYQRQIKAEEHSLKSCLAGPGKIGYERAAVKKRLFDLFF